MIINGKTETIYENVDLLLQLEHNPKHQPWAKDHLFCLCELFQISFYQTACWNKMNVFSLHLYDVASRHKLLLKQGN